MRQFFSYLIMLFATTIMLSAPTVSLAATPTVSHFSYDATSHMLSGQTSPDATINVNGMAGTITSDANGYFEVPIPESMKSVKLFIINQNGEDNTVIYHIDNQEGHVHNNDLSAQNCPLNKQENEHHSIHSPNTSNVSSEEINSQSESSYKMTTDDANVIESSNRNQSESSELATSTSTQQENKSHSEESKTQTEEHSPMPWGIIGIGIAIGLILLFIIYKIRHRYHRKH